jgi:hypothetical protein
VAILIAPQLDLHPRCEHVKGHGGGPQSVQRMAQTLQTHRYTWVCRTDVKGYYRHINKDRLMAQVTQHIADPVQQALIQQYIHYTVEDGGEFHTPQSGIARGCALSPLMGALHLADMDRWFANEMNKKKGIYYARYMDDIVILAHTRWQLRKQVRVLNGFFNEAGFCQHPDKTFTGRTERGFDWMGAQMSDAGVEGIAHRARVNHLELLRRLYEHVRKWPAARRQARMSQYRAKWTIWAIALVGAVSTHASANIGSDSELDSGIRACLLDTSIYDSKGNIVAGSVCSVPLTGGSWKPIAGSPVLGTANYTVDGSVVYAELNTSGGSFSSITLKPSGNTVMSCSGYSDTLALSGKTLTTSKTTVSSAKMIVPCTGGVAGFYNTIGPQDLNLPQAGASLAAQLSTQPSATLTLTFNAIPKGNTIRYPSVSLAFGLNAVGKSYLNVAYIGIAGSGGVDPNPPQPPVVGDPPNCTAITGVSAINYDFGNATPGTAVGEITTTKNLSHAIALDCTSGPNGSVPAAPTLYMSSSNTHAPGDDYALISSTGDWLALGFKFPATMLNGITKDSYQDGSDVKFNGTAKTPVVKWSIPAYAGSGTVGVPALVLTPYIKQLYAKRGTTEGQRTFSVTYSVVMQ